MAIRTVTGTTVALAGRADLAYASSVNPVSPCAIMALP